MKFVIFAKIIISESFFVSNNFVSEGNGTVFIRAFPLVEDARPMSAPATCHLNNIVPLPFFQALRPLWRAPFFPDLRCMPFSLAFSSLVTRPRYPPPHIAAGRV